VLAEQALELARAMSPDRLSHAMPAFLNTFASAEYRNGNWKQALDALDRAAAISDAPPPSTMLLRRALCLHRLGDSTEARRCYEEALDHPRGDPYEAQFNFDTLRQEAAALFGGD
jgi:Flp pilus assembly protein TadD